MFFKKHWPMISSVTNVSLEERDSAKQKKSFQPMMLSVNHPPSHIRVEAIKIKARVKDRAGNTNGTSLQIVGAELRNVSAATSIDLPSLNNHTNSLLTRHV